MAQSAVATGPAPSVRAVLFDMDGVLCNSEELSCRAACQVMKDLYDLEVTADEFTPFAGTGEANFLGGVARKYGANYNADLAKARFFEIYINKYAKPEAGIGFPGAVELVRRCRAAGLRTAVASSADRVKVDANLAAAGFDAANDFDAIVSADLFERLKPAPDIFLAAARELATPPDNCVVIEDAAAGVQAARAAGMRCVGVTTTLSAENMKLQRPDAIRTSISHINLEDIQGLAYAHTGK